MFGCPRCDVRLKKLQKGQSCLWACGTCKGRLATIATLRRMLDPGFVNRLWTGVRAARSEAAIDCPGCRRKLRACTAGSGETRLKLDACPGCQLVWFDVGEYDAAPTRRAETAIENGVQSPASREAAGVFQAVEARDELVFARDLDEAQALDLLTGFGDPSGTNAVARPWLAWAGAAACVLATVGFHALSPENQREFAGFGEAWRDATLRYSTVGAMLVAGVTHVLVHSSAALLVLSLMGFLVLLPAVEDARGRFALLLLLCCAGIPTVPIVLDAPPLGAGAVLTAAFAWYASEHPRARMALLPDGFPGSASPAVLWFAVWCAAQLAVAFAVLGVLGALEVLCGAFAGFAWSRFPRLALRSVP